MDPHQQVRVTNRNPSWIIRDKYAGVEYTFQPGEPVLVAAEVAEHIFGFGLDEKERFRKFMRMGIANMPKGKEMWAKVDVKPVGNVELIGTVKEAA